MDLINTFKIRFTFYTRHAMYIFNHIHVKCMHNKFISHKQPQTLTNG